MGKLLEFRKKGEQKIGDNQKTPQERWENHLLDAAEYARRQTQTLQIDRGSGKIGGMSHYKHATALARYRARLETINQMMAEIKALGGITETVL